MKLVKLNSCLKGETILSGIESILKNGMENHLFPFFWQHGEEKEVLEAYMDKIADSGISGACIEARPHPQFVGAKWWEDLDCIIAKAKERNMKLWILDDSHFPTGYANGRVKSDYPQYLKKYLGYRRFDVQGPVNGARIDFKLLKGRPWDKADTEKEIIGVYLAKRTSQDIDDHDSIDPDTLINITEKFDHNKRLLNLDVPDGAYSIFVVYITREEGEETTKDYLNPLVKEATQILIDEVYQPHFEHYKEEFGKTIQGFFSDEPRFGNIKGTEASIGRTDMVLPWADSLIEKIDFSEIYLPLLWVPAQGKESEIRLKYMDLITRLYSENFTKVLSDWCESHDVWYLGHTIEDNGAHARLGYGTGHFFRGQKDMHMSGIDVIGGQIVPGMNYHHDAFSTGGSNGEFYHYALAKLGTSAAHLDPKKKGRTMCEAFGAYGWNEGLKMMKWIADHLMVRGVNYIVPHAFDPKKFPDFDCPPHFYAHGHNPQFRYMKTLNDYMNRVTSLFKEGKQPAKVGVLYPAESEWMGEYMPIEKPARELTVNQISFDIVSIDYLKTAEIKDRCYTINGVKFEVFVVPYSENISGELADLIAEMNQAGIQTVFVNEFPKNIIPAGERSDICKNSKVIPLKKLGEDLNIYQDIVMEKNEQDLVVGKYQVDDTHIYMFFNENVGTKIETEIQFKEIGTVFRYDAFGDKLCAFEKNSDNKYDLLLDPYESVIVMIHQNADTSVSFSKDKIYGNDFTKDWNQILSDHADWEVTFGDSFAYPDCNQVVPSSKPGLIHTLDGWDDKCGTVRYTTKVKLEQFSNAILDLGNAYEIAEVFVNGKSAGQRICRPYQFDLSEVLTTGDNTLTIEITNTLGTAIRDAISHYLMMEPFGIEGPVKLYMN